MPKLNHGRKRDLHPEFFTDERVMMVEPCARLMFMGLWCIADRDISILILLGGLRAVLRFGNQPRPGQFARRIVENFLHGHVPPHASRGCRERSA